MTLVLKRFKVTPRWKEAGCPLQKTSKNSIQSCRGSNTAGSSKYATSTNAKMITCHPPCEEHAQHPIWVACTNEWGSNADSKFAKRPPCQGQAQRPSLAAYTNTHWIGEEIASGNTRHPPCERHMQRPINSPKKCFYNLLISQISLRVGEHQICPFISIWKCMPSIPGGFIGNPAIKRCHLHVLEISRYCSCLFYVGK